MTAANKRFDRNMSQVDRPRWRHFGRLFLFFVWGDGNPVRWLWVILISIVSFAFIMGLKFHQGMGICEWMFSSLFDIGTVIKSKGLGSLASALLFGFTWFLGSGALFSALVARYLEYRGRRHVGLIHHNFSHEKDHILIFGWDYNVAALLRNISESREFNGVDAQRQRVAIITMQQAAALRQAVRTSGKSDNLRVSVCRGNYDNVADLAANFSLKLAKEIYILGEPDEQDHDGQMLNLLAKLNAALKGGCGREMRAHVKINSYLLYNKLKRSREDDNRHSIRVDYINFYDTWSRRLWAMLPSSRAECYPAIRFMSCDIKKKVRVIVVGFSQMGQALTVEATRLSCYGDNVATDIVVLDENISAKLDGFLREFPNINKNSPIVNHGFQFLDVEDFRAERFLRTLERLVDGDTQTSILFSMSDSGLALELMKDVLDLLKGKEDSFRLYVRQDILTFGTNRPGEKLLDLPECDQVYYFGFRNDASYNTWRRDIVSDALYADRKNQKKGGNKYNCIYRRERFRYRVDAWMEMLHSVGLRVVEGKCDVNHIDSAKLQTLALAEHRRWVTGEVINERSNPVGTTVTIRSLLNIDPRFNDVANDIDAVHITEINRYLKLAGYAVVAE